MNQSQLDFAVRRAMNIFDAWVDSTGVVERHSSHYSEMAGCIEDAVHCGAQEATGDHQILESEKP